MQIYRGEEDAGWILEVVDADGASTVWDDKFVTDQAAMDELLRTLRVEGMKQFNVHYRRRQQYRLGCRMGPHRPG